MTLFNASSDPDIEELATTELTMCDIFVPDGIP